MVKDVTLTKQTEVSFDGNRCWVDGYVRVCSVKVPSRSVYSSVTSTVASRGVIPSNMVLHRFHHHNGVVHHQADGQDQPEQRERIDGEAQQGERR